jgi:hypothetical protein
MKSLTFKSHDFYTCCCLLASGFILKAIEPTSGKFANFVFEDPDKKAEEVINEHWAGELKLSTKDFVAAINELKTRLNSVI